MTVLDTPINAASAPPLSNGTRSRRARRGGVAVIAAAGAGATGLIGRALGADLVIDNGTGEAIDLVTITGSTFAAALTGWGGLALLERITRSAATWWTAIALAIVAVSFGPVFQADASVGTTWVLVAWHVVAAVAIVAGMRLTTRNAARETGDMS